MAPANQALSHTKHSYRLPCEMDCKRALPGQRAVTVGISLLPVEHFSHLRKKRRHQERLLEKVDAPAVNAFVDKDIPGIPAHEDRLDRRAGANDPIKGFFAVLPRHYHVEDDEVYVLLPRRDGLVPHRLRRRLL